MELFDNLEHTIMEARRFILKAEEAKRDIKHQAKARGFYFRSKKVASALRASYELSNALVVLRRRKHYE